MKNIFVAAGRWVAKTFQAVRKLRFSIFKKIFQILSPLEKIILFVLIIVFLASAGFFAFERITKKNTAPDFGGKYIEAVIANSLENLEPIIQELENVSLIEAGDNGEISPKAAERWEISDDGLTYKFFLRSSFNAADFLESIQSEQEAANWEGIEVKSPDEKTLEFHLKNPLGNFLSLMDKPLLPEGPYKLIKKEKGGLVFKSNKDFYLGRPYIDTLEIKIYSDKEILKKKFAKDGIEGFINGVTNEIGFPADFNNYIFPLPRYEAVFFNLKRDAVKDKNIRKNLAVNAPLGKNVELNLVTSQNESNLKTAADLKNKWEKLGAKINIISYTSAKLQNEIIPKRDFDLLLFGLDYGLNPDYFSFWHSSQIESPGMNLSGFADAKADKILEGVRATGDAGKKKEKIDEFLKIFNEETPAIILDQITANYHINKKMKGVKIHPISNLADRFSDVSGWYIRERKVK